MIGHLSLPPAEMLLRLAPLAFTQALVFAYATGELADFTLSSPPASLIWALAGNGAIAFALNIVSFTANQSTGALTMTVCANLKQCLTVLVGARVFGVRVSLVNGLGMVVAILGAAWYSIVEIRDGKGCT